MQLDQVCSELGFEYLPGQVEALCEEAVKKDWNLKEFLTSCLATEWEGQRLHLLEARRRLARFPFVKTLGQFDFSFQPSVERKQIRELEGLAFVGRAENVILLGPPGVGKTHLAIGLGLQALEGGHSVFFLTLESLITQLGRAEREGRLEKKLQELIRPKLLILDELGYLPLSRVQASFLFQLVSRRYERGSIVITSNKSFSQWGEVFSDQVMATAILDRLLHHSTIINIKGESYRLKEKRKSGILGKTPRMATDFEQVRSEEPVPSLPEPALEGV